MPEKPTYEELEQRVKELESEAFDRKREGDRQIRALDLLRKAEDIGKSGCWFLDLQSNREIWSHGEYQLHGLSKDLSPSYELHLKCVHPEDRAQHAGLFKEYLRSDKTHFSQEYRIQTKDGTIKYVQAGYEIVRDDNGRALSASGTDKDITELKQAEGQIERTNRQLMAKQQELAENEDRFRGLFDNMISGSAIYEVINDGSKGSDYIIRGFNNTSLKLEGKTIEQVVGKSLFDLRPTIDEYGLIPVLKEVWETGIPAHFPSKIYHDENFSNYYENNVFKIPSGEVVTIYNDVTDRKNTEMALKESNQRFELAMRFSNDGLYDWNLQTNGIYFSPGWKRMLGYEDHEIKNELSEWERLTRPEDVKASWVMLNELFQDKRERFEIEFQMQHKEGHWVDILSRANVVRGEDGTAIRVVGTHVDITERKRMEAALRENEKFYRDIFEKNRAMKILVDPDSGDIIDANSAACEFYQYSPKEITALKVWDINVLSETETKKQMARAICGEESDFMFDQRLSSGQIRHVQVYSGPIGKRGKKLLHSIIIDRTERKRSKEALKASERKYRLLTENMKDVVWVLDVESMRFQYVSPSVKRLCGYTPEEIMAVPIHHALTREAASQIVDLAKRHAKDLQTGQITSDDFLIMQVEQPCKDGSTVWTEMVTNFYINPDNNKVEILGVARDITDRVEAEAETKRLQDQLVQAHKMESIGTLAGGIAHDFNNILAIILGNVELASDTVSDGDPEHEFLAEIYRASIRAKDMVKQLLAFSRKTDEANKPLNLVSVVNDSLKMLRTAIPASVEFKTHVTDETSNVLGDEAQINQIVMNLATNAAHAMSEKGGILEVTLENKVLREEKPCFNWVLSPGNYARMRVKDTGTGIDPQIMDRIFEPYYTTKEVGKGTGMGLSVVQGIVKRHGGGIRAESEMGKGTLFEIFFPLQENYFAQEKGADRDAEKGTGRILFVDDEISIVKLNQKRLERLGYHVTGTTKPEEALEWFKAAPEDFDVIISDMTMPKMTGDRLTREIRAIRPEIPVILCSGYSDKIFAEEAEALGAQKFIEKPIDAKNLASALGEVLGG